MKPKLTAALALITSAATLAGEPQAATLVREGKAADAIDALTGQSSPEAEFWRGRALIELGRLQEAASALEKVPAGHELYPYAAKALLYCAWKSKRVDFAVIATPMATCDNKEIATLATAALAEHWIMTPKGHDNTALERLRRMAESQPELQSVLQLLEINNLRAKGEFDKAIVLCRQLESDHSKPILVRQRARLALSDIYYAKEEAAGTQDFFPSPPLNQEDENHAVEYDDGKGEETLLHFISSHPDSPLLEEAFRRLHERNAFQNSEYARTKLREWMSEPLKSRRAAQALLIQQHLLNPENAREISYDVSCANTAAATCPHEPATRTILLEQTRWFLESQHPREALLYLGMVQGDDATRQFYETQLHNPAMPSTARAYLACAREAPETLRTAALENALLSALLAGDTGIEEAVLNLPDLSEEQRFALLRARAAYWLDKDPAKAQADLNVLLSQQAPTLNLRADVEMDQACLQLQDQPEAARELLLRSKINEHLTQLSDERQLRFFALQEAVLKEIARQQDQGDGIKESLELVRQAAGKVNSPQVVSVLTLHLASLLSADGQYTEAMKTLDSLLRKYPRSDFAPRALYMSARVSELIGTMDSLNRAAELYTTCAERSEELRIKATTRRAAVLLRLGRHEESEQIIEHMLRTNPDMRSQDKALAHAVLANNKALLGTPEGREEAISIAAQALADTKLPRWWRYRVLLHHATLCARAGRYEESLKDYEEVLAMQPATGQSPSAAEWHILYSAGAGAVMQLVNLKRYDEAASKADEIANWNKEEASLAKRKQFSDWAEFIRQTNFVDGQSLPF